MIVALFLASTSLILTSTTILVMAEEFEQLPKFLQRISSTLVHDRTRRTGFICLVIVLMAITSSVSLVTLPDDGPNNQTVIISESLAVMQPESGVYLYKNITNSKEIILNLSLTAKVHQNVTINGATSGSCSNNCIRDLLNGLDLTNVLTDRNNITDKTAGNIVIMNDKLTRYSRSLKVRRYFNSIMRTYNFNPIRPKREVVRNTTDSESPKFSHPEYIVFTWVLCLIALATALKLYYLIKLFLAVVMLIVYFILIQLPYNNYFDNTSIKQNKE